MPRYAIRTVGGLLVTVAVLVGLAPSGQAFETERAVQGITRTDERIERAKAEQRWERWVAEVQARLAARTAARMEAAAEAAYVPSTTYSSYSGGVLSAAQVAAYARGAGFPEDVVDDMVAIAWRESRFDPGAVNPSSGACGLWQMYPCPGEHALDPATNAEMAYSKWRERGLEPWGY